MRTKILMIVTLALLTSGCSKGVNSQYLCLGPELNIQKSQDVGKSFKDKFKGSKNESRRSKIEKAPRCIRIPEADKFMSFQAQAMSSNLLIFGINGYAKYGFVFPKGTIKSRKPRVAFSTSLICEGTMNQLFLDGKSVVIRSIWDVKKNQRGSTKPMFGFMEV